MKARRTSILLAATIALVSAVAWLLADDSSPTPAFEPVSELGIAPSATLPASLARTETSTEYSVASKVEALQASVPRVAMSQRTWPLRIWGRVVSADGEQPIAGAEINILLTDQNDERPRQLAILVADESGEFSRAIEIDASWYDDEGEYLNVGVAPSVWAPGFASGEYYTDVDLVEQADVEFQVELSPGADVSGYVFGSNGEPVQADVYFHLDGTEEIQADSVDDDGFYQFQVTEGGPASVRARGRTEGTALIERAIIDPRASNRMPDMFLAGAGAIGGVLVDPDGEPIVGHSVQLIADTLIGNLDGDAKGWNFTLGDSESNVNAERGDGRLFGEQTTRGGGTFHFKGLRPGRYMLLARVESNGKLLETARRLHSTGELDVLLVLGVHRLVVTVNGGQGVSSVHCAELNDDDDVARGGKPRRFVRPMRRKPAVFEVQPGRTYVVGLDDESPNRFVFSFGTATPGPWKVPSGDQEVVIQEGKYVTHVELDLTREIGRVVLDVDDASESEAYHVRIESSASGRRVHSGKVSREDLPLSIELAVGEYDVRVYITALGGMAFRRGSVEFATPQSELEINYQVDSDWQEVEVLAGGRSSLMFEFKTGGRLVVATPLNIVTSPVFDPSESFVFFPVGAAYSQAEFELENARGHRTRRLDFGTHRPLIGAESAPEGSQRRDLDSVLSVGSYVLYWRNPDDEVRKLSFEIRAGETTSIEFENE